jgi:two-component system cell cycle sensor histidine kinase/response regulator CckA
LNGKGVILVVDDTPECLILLSDIFTRAGYEVRPADTGELALAAAAAIVPELILLDIRMPGMGGFEVCRRLKAMTETRDIPIIFISASPEPQERVEGWRLGAVDFVSKPFDRQEMIARVGTRLELSRLQKRLEQVVAERTAKLQSANRQLREELAERTRAEQALRESEARFRSMADTASALIWTSGPDTRIDFCNAHALSFTGRTLEELAGEGWKAVVHPEDMELRYRRYVPMIEAHEPYQAEYRLRRADGEYRWMLHTATPRLLPDGTFAGYVGIAIDVTDLRRNMEQLLASQKYESVGILVAGLAHRFNNLMGTIIAEADLAASELSPESAEHASVMRINAAALRASEIVSLLMAYAGGGAAAPAPLDISQTIEEVLRLFKATAFKTVDLTFSLANRLPPVEADVTQIRQIVINLLTNAQEAIADGEGSIRLTASSVSIATAEAATQSGVLTPGEYVRLEVTDTGRGIPEEALLRIFDPFYTTNGFGRGLGLSAVQGIVRSLRGTIRVQSAPGRGSTFEVLLPAWRSGERL